jgi:polysaccharide biosynthesis/export protein
MIGLFREDQLIPRRARLSLISFCSLVLVACFAVQSWAANDAKETGVYRVAPGDRIIVTVFGQTELSGDFLIDGNGDISVPLVGQIAVADLTPSECEELIKTRLSDGFLNNPSVSVRVGDLRPIYVIGSVRTPGSYAYRYGTTVRAAVALAGGVGAGPALDRGAAAAAFLAADERLRPP